MLAPRHPPWPPRASAVGVLRKVVKNRYDVTNKRSLERAEGLLKMLKDELPAAYVALVANKAERFFLMPPEHADGESRTAPWRSRRSLRSAH